LGAERVERRVAAILADEPTVIAATTSGFRLIDKKPYETELINQARSTMGERRFFFFSGNADDAFKVAARKSLIDAKWMPVQEFSEPVHVLGGSGPDRGTCNLLSPAEFHFAILAERS
jgi:hypothetical protein